jgi:hypothetical protein
LKSKWFQKLKVFSLKTLLKMNTNMNTKLTPENASKYIGREILFTYNGATVKRTLLKVSESGKTIHVDHPETRNNLQLVSRKIFVVDDELADAALKIPVLKRQSAQEFIFPVFRNGEFIRGDDLEGDVVCESVENSESIAKQISECMLPPYIATLNKKDNSWPQDEEEDGETYFMCTGKCKRVCHYEDTNDVGMCGTCHHKIQSKKRK